MSGEASGRRAEGAVITTSTSVSGRRASVEERRRLVAESLNVGNPANNAKALPDVADPRFECQLDLGVDEIRPYDHNPRRASNARFDEIKESIRASGIRNPLTVTRRPAERHFIVEAGGNTRLIAIQQLWAETKETQFQRITVMFRPWRSESHVLIAHLIENEQRGELTYWDKANGIMALKRELESERGRSLSLRQMEDELRELGFSVDKARLSRYQFAADKLKPLGEATSGLSGLDVKIIQPRLNLFKRYAEKRAGMAEANLYAQVLDHVFQRHGDQFVRTRLFDLAEIALDCEQALADHFGEPITRLRIHLDALAKRPELSFDSLKAHTDVAATTAPPAVATREIAPVAPTALSGVVTDNTEPNLAPGRTPGHSTGRSLGPGREGRLGSSSVAHDGVMPAKSQGASSSSPHVHQATPSSVSSPETPAPSERLQRLKDCVTQFAGLTEVSDCLTFCAALPCGYYMELPSSPLDLEPDKSLRHRAWWLLALLCGQMHDALTLRMPVASRWRRAHEADGSDDTAMPLLIENELGGLVYFDLELANWLLDPTDELATLFWELVLHVRELKLAMPHSFATDTKRHDLEQAE